MKKAIYPGTFDPITNGHLDILERAIKVFDFIDIAVVKNVNKDPLFNAEERVEIIRECTKDILNVKVEKFDGLVVDFAQKVGASVIIRGLRALSDFEYEFQMALMNRHLDNDVDTVFFMPSEENTYLSSSMIREIVKFDGDISCFVPEYVKNKLIRKIRSNK